MELRNHFCEFLLGFSSKNEKSIIIAVAINKHLSFYMAPFGNSTKKLSKSVEYAAMHPALFY
jgi:hypothetical protein